MRREGREKASRDIKIYPSTHLLISELRAKLHRVRGETVGLAEAVEFAVQLALDTLGEG